MANWITHTVIADKILEKGLKIDKVGFTVGNIAPDCNVENEDRTDFTPSRETTHFMSEKNQKSTVDCEKFYENYIKDRRFDNGEQYAFLWGYYSHLITDREYQINFVRNEQRVKSSFERIKANKRLQAKIDGYPENLDTLKTVFGRSEIFGDIKHLEHAYLLSHPDSSYNTVLRNITDFSDYIDFLPQGAILRKIKIMAFEPPAENDNAPLVFFSQDEYSQFISNVVTLIFESIAGHIK